MGIKSPYADDFSSDHNPFLGVQIFAETASNVDSDRLQLVGASYSLHHAGFAIVYSRLTTVNESGE